MKFKISEKHIKTKLIIDMSLVLIIAIIFLTIEIIDIEFIIVILILLFSMIGVNFYEFYSSKTKIKNHILEITSKGIVFFDDIETIISWNKILEVKLKQKKLRLTKLIIITDSNKIDLSKYENLDRLNLELQYYLDKNL